ncbi:MAG TPA: phospholipase D-like domain-containing protein, partial [Gemmatimonadales bacterium]|nr:phospholipase D-like domain-containing protein [Gemmatimonadales bacterium]
GGGGGSEGTAARKAGEAPPLKAVALLTDWWQVLAGALTFALSVAASGHAILYKRDSRAAVGWVGLIWLAPVVGAALYALLGVNRIQRRAAEQRALRPGSGVFERPAPPGPPAQLPAEAAHLAPLAELVQRLTARPLTGGNAVTPLVNGDAAYPAMLAAIDAGQRTIGLSTYIFDNDAVGRTFLDALERARHRGVEVRVLIDAVGARYSWPPIFRALRARGIAAAAFGRTLLPWRMPYLNLRNHRKLLVVDGQVGFTGGMNIRAGHLLASRPRHPVQDLHFRLEGPVVRHLVQAFADDWSFTTEETLEGEAWFPDLRPAGPVLARGLTDGPDEDFEKARFTRLGALACAREEVRIVTPYFLPDAGLVSELGVTAMRGVRVEILLPAVNNLALVQWASTAELWQVLGRGCLVYYTPPPFDHTKLLLVDRVWALIGSSNWDPRSLRLNFEFDVECYDAALAKQLNRLVETKLAGARPVTLEEVNGRSLPIKLRDGVARLAGPYL